MTHKKGTRMIVTDAGSLTLDDRTRAAIESFADVVLVPPEPGTIADLVGPLSRGELKLGDYVEHEPKFDTIVVERIAGFDVKYGAIDGAGVHGGRFAPGQHTVQVLDVRPAKPPVQHETPLARPNRAARRRTAHEIRAQKALPK